MFSFNREATIKAKRQLHRDHHAGYVWKQYFAPSPKVGNCTNLYRKLLPTSCEDFYEKYVRYAEENQQMPIRDRGLGETELRILAENYKAKSEQNGTPPIYDVETYLNDALCHIITETWDGQSNEREFMDFLENSLPVEYKCSKFPGALDTKYGLDIKVVRDDGKVSAIQIKPISFFKSNRPDVQADRISLCEKYIAAISDLSVKTYYAIYEKDKKTGETRWLRNTDGRFRFKIDHLFGFEPRDISGTFVRKKLPTEFSKLQTQ